MLSRMASGGDGNIRGCGVGVIGGIRRAQREGVRRNCPWEKTHAQTPPFEARGKRVWGTLGKGFSLGSCGCVSLCGELLPIGGWMGDGPELGRGLAKLECGGDAL